MQEMPDTAILSQIAKGDMNAFRELMLRYEPRIYHFTLKLVRSEELAEEITQDAFIRLWESRESIGDIESVGAWLHTLSKNRALNMIREKAARYAREETYAGMAELQVSPEENINLNDYMRIVDNLVAQLPPKRKEIFLLKTREGLTIEEIGRLLNLSPHTVKNQLGKSYLTIRQLMSDLIYMLPVTLLF